LNEISISTAAQRDGYYKIAKAFFRNIFNFNHISPNILHYKSKHYFYFV